MGLLAYPVTGSLELPLPGVQKSTARKPEDPGPSSSAAPFSNGYVEVAIPVPLRQRFTYALPANGGKPPVGARVAVPFGRRKVVGVVLAHTDSAPPQAKRIKPIAALVDEAPVVAPELLHFLQEMADYYLHPVGEVLRAATPGLTSANDRALRDSGFVQKGQRIARHRTTEPTTWYVQACPTTDPTAAPPRLGKLQKALLETLGDQQWSLEALRPQFKTARNLVRALADKGLVRWEERPAPDPFFTQPVEQVPPPTLTGEQQQAVDHLLAKLPNGLPNPVASESVSAESPPPIPATLLQGVTGSGKTEIYLRLAQQAQSRKLGTLLLVPEIALTPQLVTRFRERLGDQIAVLHSELTQGRRDRFWTRLRQGEIRVVVGARSALFAPVENLGLIIVDEEHDPSFKQEEGFRYHARDMAMLRAHRAGALCILGSATPSVETRHLAHEGRIDRQVLTQRPTSHPLPKVEVVDLARHREGPSKNRWLSAPLHRALDECLKRGEQAMLFLNRRGFANALRCDSCATTLECPACAVTLTEHRGRNLLRCHYCDYQIPVPRECPECHSHSGFLSMGTGTEQLQTLLAEQFPEANVGRLDRDTAPRGSEAAGAESILSNFRSGKTDILVGTQMISKGHDIAGVTLVGVIAADQSLAFPDFRATERTFQLLSQVAGRAGRGDKPGRVMFQAFQGDHPAIQFATQHDYEGFFKYEVAARQEVGYPPAARLAALRVDAGDEAQAKQAMQTLAHRAQQVASGLPSSSAVHIVGPAPAPILRIRGRYRYRLLLKSGDRRALRHVVQSVLPLMEGPLRPARAHIDLDPVSML